MSEFEPVIGLEVHVQLATNSKIFCGCKARVSVSDGGSVADEAVNGNTCPICSGHPGTLPVLNKRAVEFAIKAGLATHCKIRNRSVFSRKNYFYPDLPKGYQISQYDEPLCEDGFLEIELKGGEQKRVGLERIHMEEDAGKNVHMSGFSMVNLNRAGVPLIEIVSRPDMRSAQEAGAYLRALYAIVTYLEICDGNLQEGNFRCDANVSVRPRGQKEFNTRAEVKNVNSFRFVEKAVEYEIARQIEVMQSGGKVVQETRLYDSAKNKTSAMRSKEEAHDYRYFPEPDLITLLVEDRWIEKIQSALPELPAQKKQRFVQEFQLSSYDAGVLTSDKPLAQFYEESVGLLAADANKGAKVLANLLTGEVARLVNEEETPVQDSRLKPQHLADLVKLLLGNVISSTAAKQVLGSIWKSGDAVESVVEKQGLKQVSDTSALEPVVEEILSKNAEQVKQYLAGKEKLMGFFVGQLMKATKGKANPQVVQDLLKEKLKARSSL